MTRYVIGPDVVIRLAGDEAVVIASITGEILHTDGGQIAGH